MTAPFRAAGRFGLAGVADVAPFLDFVAFGDATAGFAPALAAACGFVGREVDAVDWGAPDAAIAIPSKAPTTTPDAAKPPRARSQRRRRFNPRSSSLFIRMTPLEADPSNHPRRTEAKRRTGPLSLG